MIELKVFQRSLLIIVPLTLSKRLQSKPLFVESHFLIIIEETTPKEIHRIVGRGGNTIAESDSWLGMIGQYVLVTIGAVLIIAIIGAILCGIGSLFK